MTDKQAWNKGRSWSKATRRRISERRKGIAAWNKGKAWSDEVKQKISMSRKGQPVWNKGRPWAKKVREKISQSKTGQKTWNKGRTWPDEIIAKISASKKGQNPWNKGKKWPEEVKKKISRAKLVRSISSEPYYKRHTITPRLRYLVFKRDNYRCTICGRSQSDGVILEADHINPESKGGFKSLENLRTLCRDCNQGRSNLDI